MTYKSVPEYHVHITAEEPTSIKTPSTGFYFHKILLEQLSKLFQGWQYLGIAVGETWDR